MTADKYCKKTAEIILNNKTGDAIKTCLRLAELETKWTSVVGKTVAERSAPVAWEISKDNIPTLTINVDDAGIVQAIKFRRTAIIKSLKVFLGIPSVKIEICVGKVVKQSIAKEPVPAFKRRYPVIIAENDVEKTVNLISHGSENTELDQAIARLKILSENNMKNNR